MNHLNSVGYIEGVVAGHARTLETELQTAAATIARLTREKEELHAKTKEIAKDFELAFRLVRQENDSLANVIAQQRAELAAAKQQRDELKERIAQSQFQPLHLRVDALTAERDRLIAESEKLRNQRSEHDRLSDIS